MAASIEELNESLADFEPVAKQAILLKEEMARAEAEIVEQIITILTPLVPLIDKSLESYYRKNAILAARGRAAPLPLDKVSRFYSEHHLVLYETGQLWDLHRFGETCCIEGRPGWEITEERELSPKEAVAAFGLQAIVDGTIDVLQNAKSTVVLKELEARISTLTKTLEALK